MTQKKSTIEIILITGIILGLITVTIYNSITYGMHDSPW
jgi:hypothetical protein